MTRVIVIPARGGSKRIPKKNIKSFCGEPMLARAIGSALASGVADRVIVSTDCEETAQIARTSGAEVPFKRPDELADDHATTIDVMRHAISTAQETGARIDAACCLYPCTPFTTGEMIRAAYGAWMASEADYGFPVCAFPSAPQRALRRDSAGRVRPLDDAYENTRTQDLEPAFFDAGQFYWGKAQAWLARKSVHANGFARVTDWLSCVDIDTPEDWMRAEILFRALHSERTSR